MTLLTSTAIADLVAIFDLVFRAVYNYIVNKLTTLIFCVLRALVASGGALKNAQTNADLSLTCTHVAGCYRTTVALLLTLPAQPVR